MPNNNTLRKLNASVWTNDLSGFTSVEPATGVCLVSEGQSNLLLVYLARVKLWGSWNSRPQPHDLRFDLESIHIFWYSSAVGRIGNTHTEEGGPYGSCQTWDGGRSPEYERIWVTHNAKTPVARFCCLPQAEEGHRGQSRVRLLLFLLWDTVWITDRGCNANSQCWSNFNFQLRFLVLMLLNLRTPISPSGLTATVPPVPFHLLLIHLLLIVTSSRVDIMTRAVLPVGCWYSEPHLLLHLLLLLPLRALCVLKARSPLAISHDRASGRATLKGMSEGERLERGGKWEEWRDARRRDGKCRDGGERVRRCTEEMTEGGGWESWINSGKSSSRRMRQINSQTIFPCDPSAAKVPSSNQFRQGFSIFLY